MISKTALARVIALTLTLLLLLPPITAGALTQDDFLSAVEAAFAARDAQGNAIVSGADIAPGSLDANGRLVVDAAAISLPANILRGTLTLKDLTFTGPLSLENGRYALQNVQVQAADGAGITFTVTEGADASLTLNGDSAVTGGSAGIRVTVTSNTSLTIHTGKTSTVVGGERGIFVDYSGIGSVRLRTNGTVEGANAILVKIRPGSLGDAEITVCADSRVMGDIAASHEGEGGIFIEIGESAAAIGTDVGLGAVHYGTGDIALMIGEGSAVSGMGAGIGIEHQGAGDVYVSTGAASTVTGIGGPGMFAGLPADAALSLYLDGEITGGTAGEPGATPAMVIGVIAPDDAYTLADLLAWAKASGIAPEEGKAVLEAWQGKELLFRYPAGE